MKTLNMQRRKFIHAFLAAGVVAPAALHAQPRTETLRILHGYSAGGSVDVVCRKLAEKLTGSYARHALVDSKPGAAGRLAIEELKHAHADGSVLLVAPASAFTLYPHVYRQLSYDVFADVTPVSTVASTGFALAVGPKVPPAIDGFEAFRKWCRADPSVAQCGNAGAGSLPHFLALLLARDTGIGFSHVPYRSGSAAMQAAAAGELAAALATEAAARPLQQAGKLRVLATSWPARSPIFPAAPSFSELGLPALAQREWFGAFMPARAPTDVVQAAADALHAALAQTDVQGTWERTGLGVESSTPAQLQTAIRREYDFWAPVVKASGFTPDS